MAGKRRIRGEGSVIYDQARKRWVGRVWLDGKRYQVSDRDQMTCSLKLGKLVHTDAGDRKADRKVTVGSLVAEWAEKALPNRTMAPATTDLYGWVASLVLADPIAKRSAAAVTAADIEKCLARLVKQKALSRSSVSKVRSMLGQVFAWAVRRGTLARNPANGVELPTDATRTKPRRALTAEQVRDLFTALEGHRRRALYVTMATTGLRPGEASALCRDAVDLEAGTVTVCRAIRLERSRPTLAVELKTRSSYRTLALPTVALDALCAQIEATGATGTDVLFPGDEGGLLWPSTVRAELAELGNAIGVGPIRPNELRHTAATLLVDHLPLHVVADILGHTTTRMLDQTYRHRPAVVAGAGVLDAALS